MRREEREKRRGERLEFVFTALRLGAQLVFRLGVLLGVLEVLAWFGATNPVSRMMDEIAMGFTAVLLLLSTVGVWAVFRWIRRGTAKDGV